MFKQFYIVTEMSKLEAGGIKKFIKKRDFFIPLVIWFITNLHEVINLLHVTTCKTHSFCLHEEKTKCKKLKYSFDPKKHYFPYSTIESPSRTYKVLR